MTHPTAKDLLRAPLFGALSPDAAELIAERFDIENYGPGRNLVTEGHPGYAFYVLDSGSALVTHGGEELRTLVAGDFFGEIAIIGEGRRTATVTATEPVTVWTMFGTAFRELEMSRPDVATQLQDTMRERLANG